MDFCLKGLMLDWRSSLRKKHLSLNLQCNALLKCLRVGTNWRPFESREVSSLVRFRLDKLITLGLTKLALYLLPSIPAALDNLSGTESLKFFFVRNIAVVIISYFQWANFFFVRNIAVVMISYFQWANFYINSVYWL